MSSNFGRVWLLTTELFALERSNWLWMGKMVSPSCLSYYEGQAYSQTSSNFGRIWPVILELGALEQWKKWCLWLFSVTFDWIFVKLAGNEDRHKSSNEFEFGPDRIIHFGIIRPWAWKFFPIDFKWEKGKTIDFSEIIVIYDLKLATDDRSDKKFYFLLTSKLCPLGAVCPLLRGYIHVLNHEKNCIKSDFKEISLKLATNG